MPGMRSSALLLTLAVAVAGPAGCDPADDDAQPVTSPAATSSPVTPSSVTSPPLTSPPVTAEPAPPPARPECPTTDTIDAAVWTRAEGGRSLAVTPRAALRGCAGPLVRVEGTPPGWAEVVQLAGAEADTPVMLQQYLCHLRFAPAKDTWNLEPWRPEVDEETLLGSACNP